MADITLDDLQVEAFTVSYAADVGGGRKSSHFVSMNFRPPPGCSADEIEIARLQAARRVTVWAFRDAVLRGEMTAQEFTERMAIVKENYEGLLAATERARAKKTMDKDDHTAVNKAA